MLRCFLTVYLTRSVMQNGIISRAVSSTAEAGLKMRQTALKKLTVWSLIIPNMLQPSSSLTARKKALTDRKREKETQAKETADAARVTDAIFVRDFAVPIVAVNVWAAILSVAVKVKV